MKWNLPVSNNWSNYILVHLCLAVLCTLILPASLNAIEGFPEERPSNGSYQRPREGQVMEISPPGFCWWRAGKRDQVYYVLRVQTEGGKQVYKSSPLRDPVHVPETVFKPGAYKWTVDAVDKKGKVLDTRAFASFSIRDGFFEQPWIAPAKLLARVPGKHPRLLFPADQLDDIRATLGTTRREAFENLRKAADSALKLSAPEEPDYDEIEDPAVRRMAYKETFARLRGYHQRGMDPLALMYLLSGDKKYGLKAKEILLGATEWDPEGISSILAPYGDEVGLSIVRSEAHTYDWIYDLLSPEERKTVRKMLIARADQMLRRLEKRDYLQKPSESHNGRLPGYLIEHAIVLAEEPRAEVWMDYAMRTVMTCFPHWAGSDGGWAEGISYGLAYNTTYLVPYESLRIATDFNLWKRPFYNNVRNFFMYCISPIGDIKPFGDTEHAPVSASAGGIRSLLQFHANLFDDPTVRWWVDHLRSSDGKVATISGTQALILPDTIQPKVPDSLSNDAAFFGVGWAALHSNIMEPEEDLFLLFKSSPYGGVSHSHADQNSFALMKGGKSLFIPGGARWPGHGSPYHKEYVQQTLAHNALLINGEGQINRDGSRGGELIDFQQTEHMSYTAGDATNCFDASVVKNIRHVIMVRPSLVIIVDEVETKQPSSIQWLLHAHNRFGLDEKKQSILSSKRPAAANVNLITQGGFQFSQTNDWLVDPKKGFPKVKLPPPEKQWHFSAETNEKSSNRRIAAIMAVYEDGKVPEYSINQADEDTLEVQARFGKDSVSVKINLDVSAEGPVLDSIYSPSGGGKERVVINSL
ncbi:MAG: DUF4962 domain-containing protein [Puniceicoccaceae bacterium]